MTVFSHISKVCTTIAICSVAMLAGQTSASTLPVVRGKPASAFKQALIGVAAIPSAPAVRVMDLTAPDQSELNVLHAHNLRAATKRTQIGLFRAASASQSQTSSNWSHAANGGYVMHIKLASRGASALRAGFLLPALPEGARIAFRGADANQIIEFSAAELNDLRGRDGTTWSPVTTGEEQTISLYLPAGAVPAQYPLTVSGVSHLLSSAKDGFNLGSAAACNQDVACARDPSAAYLAAVRATAKMVYTENGQSYTCTGTLISDGDLTSQIPYFLSASHCVDTAAAAATLNTFWFLEAAGCGTKSLGQVTQLTKGARMLYSNTSSDVALLALNDAAPAGSYFAGWDANPIAVGENIIGLHHPRGDVKKVSVGQAIVADSNAPGYTSVAWLSGTTEPGSSGSGVFTQSGDQYFLRGSLVGGTASCSNSGGTTLPGNRDYYSRLEQDFTPLKKILLSGPAPYFNYSDLWTSPTETGWALTIIQNSTHQIFAVWYTYDRDGKPTWFTLQGGQWTNSQTYTATIYRSSGSPWDAAFSLSRVATPPAGSAVIQFSAENNATLKLIVDGVSINKSIIRAKF